MLEEFSTFWIPKAQAGFVINLPQVPEQTSIFVVKFVVETDDFFSPLKKDSFLWNLLEFQRKSNLVNHWNSTGAC